MLLSKLNKDELILIIETIGTNHSKEIDKLKDQYETTIDACKELGVKFKNCSFEGCNATRIKRGNPSTRYIDIHCDDMIHCETCNQYVCDKHLRNCKCFEKI